ncbi:MAG: DNA repair protein RadC, partial [Lentisphaerae bacterium]|nr:DNA repair protein RadC [Lentisphaerota bacterium]
ADMPGRERPRERLLHQGSEALSDAELLAILLRTGRRGVSVLDVARQLLMSFDGSLNHLAAATVTELRRVPGIGLAKAVEVHAAFALARRLAASAEPTLPCLSEPAHVHALLRERFRAASQEEFHVLHLDTKNHLLGTQRITTGLVDRTQIHPREVFRGAIRENCSRVLLAHNHPSGDPTPSTQDIAATRQLVEAGKIIGIEILDHIVIGNPARAQGRGFVSFRQENLM